MWLTRFQPLSTTRFFLRFEKWGDATPFSFARPVVGHEETHEEINSSIDFCFCCFNVSSPRTTTTQETEEQVAHEKGRGLLKCFLSPRPQQSAGDEQPLDINRRPLLLDIPQEGPDRRASGKAAKNNHHPSRHRPGDESVRRRCQSLLALHDGATRSSFQTSRSAKSLR